MRSGDSTWFLLAAYGVTLVLLAAEVVQLAWRARPPKPGPGDEA